MPTLIFSRIHSPGSMIRVLYGRDLDGGRGLDVLVNGVRRVRAFNSAEVTDWLTQNSKGSVDPWKAAFHKSGLSATDFKRPAPVAKDIMLKVPYHSQRDNERYPGGSCNVTSFAMAMLYLGAKPRHSDHFSQFEDELEAFLQDNQRDRHSHEDLAWAARQYGLVASFDTDRTLDDIRQHIRGGNPAVVSTKLTSAGHIICPIGTKGNDFIVHDPWGRYDAEEGKYVSKNGASVLYSGELMKAKVRDPGASLKWAHFLSRK